MSMHVWCWCRDGIYKGMTGLKDSWLVISQKYLLKFYNPVITSYYDISHAELWWGRSCKYVLKFTFFFFFCNFITDLPFLKPFKIPPKIESIKGKSLTTWLHIPLFPHPQAPFSTHPPKKPEYLTHNRKKWNCWSEVFVVSELMREKKNLIWCWTLTAKTSERNFGLSHQNQSK